ncbi:MAG TPA: S9 family peptidase [Elusimicrobiota bacterium]|nr:S9 family peptidase [Elusimicrobiota bacterium]
MTDPLGVKTIPGLPTLIPRALLFGNPDRIHPQLSPDGRYLAFLAPDSRDVLQVFLRMLETGAEKVLTRDSKRGLRAFFWTYEPDILIYLQDSDGDENFHVFRVDVRSGDTRDLTPFPGIRAQVVALEPRIPRHLLIALNKEDARKHDVYRLNLTDGSIAFDTANPGNVVAWLADAKLEIRAAMASLPDGGHEIWVRDQQTAAWRAVRRWNPDDEGDLVDWSEDGKTLYLLSSEGADTKRLISIDPDGAGERVLAGDPQNDVNSVLFDPRRRIPLAVGIYREKLVWRAVEPGLDPDLRAVSDAQGGECQIMLGDLDGRLWLLAYANDAGPIQYHLFDRRERRAQFLFSQRPQLEKLRLVPIMPAALRARDGLPLHGYLTLPVGREPASLPTVLLVHGGPWARDRWGFNPMVQWLANRGYAVLQINFRGSTGYGKAFLNAGNREWAGKMHDDLIDGVDWLVGRGIADRRRVAIMGASYGGYAALVGLTFTPEVFCCGVDIVGPSNIVTLVQTIPPYWQPLRAAFARRLGVVETDESFMKSRSPLFRADRVRAPLLIAQGAHDPRVKRAESDQMVAAMRSAGKPVDYWVYEDEGHGFARPENRMHFYAQAEAFLARYLGGRCEPEGPIANHSANRC